MCRQKGASRCPSHRLKPLLQSVHVGGRLWNWSSEQMLKMLRRYLILLGDPRAPVITLKSFRAGKATAMATEGEPLGQILQAGEWRSAAVFRYTNEDMVDAGYVLRATLETSDDDAASDGRSNTL